jgi:hypothetical protein
MTNHYIDYFFFAPDWHDVSNIFGIIKTIFSDSEIKIARLKPFAGQIKAFAGKLKLLQPGEATTLSAGRACHQSYNAHFAFTSAVFGQHIRACRSASAYQRLRQASLKSQFFLSSGFLSSGCLH